MRLNEPDVIIIGGGPAGSSAAISAAKLGCQVLLFEAEVFPRHHVGESLVALWALFDELGVTEQMDQTFQHKHGSTRLWGREPVVHSTDFSYVTKGRRYSLQVERSLFDQILLERAEAVGATVCQNHRVSALLWEGERLVGVRVQLPDGRSREVRAPLVIDAGGRGSIVARERGLHEVDPFYPDLSVYGYFRNARRFEGELAGNLLVEAVPWGWFWYIPLHTGEVSVGLVCDRTTRGEVRRRGLAGYFQAAIEGSVLVKELLAEAELVTGPIGTASFGYRSRRYAGPGWMLAGDAGAFIDPMWATGVANALQDGLLSGAMVEAIASGRVSEQDAIDEYERKVRARVTHYHQGVKFVYQCNRLHRDQPFWQQRHGLLAGEPPPTGLLQRLSVDPSARYFIGAFRGMDVDRAVLTLMEEGSAPRLQRQGGFDPAQHLDTWVPVLPPHVTVRRALDKVAEPQFPGMRPGTIVAGLEVQNHGVEIFVTDPVLTTALLAVDGQRSFREILALALETPASHPSLVAHVRVVRAFVDAYSQGVLAARDDAECRVTA
jgi:flavin-dependent dehydrogenase